MKHFTYCDGKFRRESVTPRSLAESVDTSLDADSRATAPENLNRDTVVRRRETFEDLVAGETIL